MRVEVYWNLHRNLFSVRALEGPDKGRVIAHEPTVYLSDVQFIVHEGTAEGKSGRQKVLREQRKNVHAFVRGRRETTWASTNRRVTYNPYAAPTFVTVPENFPIHRAAHATLVKEGEKARVYASVG